MFIVPLSNNFIRLSIHGFTTDLQTFLDPCHRLAEQLAYTQ